MKSMIISPAIPSLKLFSRKPGFIITLFLFCSIMLYGQLAPRGRISHFTIEQGLSHTYINTILQDKWGFLWFGTEDGLNRYDGYEFHIFKPDTQNPTSISHDRISALCEDQEGRLWIGTQGGGINLYDHTSGQFRVLQAGSNNAQELSSDFINVLYRDSTNTIWIGTDRGLHLKASGSQNITFRRISFQDLGDRHQNRDPDILAILEFKPGHLLLGSKNNGLLSFNRITGSVQRLGTSTIPRRVWQMLKGPKGHIWLATESGLYYLPAGSNTPILHCSQWFSTNNKLIDDLAHNPIRTLWLDTQEKIWVGTDGSGMYQIDTSRKQLHRLSHGRGISQSLTSKEIRAFYQDHSGVFWIGTDDGLNKYVLDTKGFHHYKQDTHHPDISFYNVHLLYQDRKDNFWVGGQDMGLVRINQQQKTSHRFLSDPQNINSLSSNQIRTMIQDDLGHYWIGTNDRGLNHLEVINWQTQSFKFTRYPTLAPAGNGETGSQVFSIVEDHQQKIWIGSDKGLSCFNQKQKIFIPVDQLICGNPKISHDYIRCIYTGTDQCLWIGTLGSGLKILIPAADNKYREVSHKNIPGNRSSLSNNDVLCFHQQVENEIWIGTHGGGLNHFNRQTGNFITYTDREGLANNVVYGILQDQDGQLWLSTNNGLSRFNPRKQTFLNYSQDDGLQSNEFNGSAFWKSADGRLYFGGKNGFNAFYPAEIQTNPHWPKILISRIWLYKNHSQQLDSVKPILKQDVSHLTQVTIPYSQRIFSLEFAGLHFVAPEKNQYATMMEGLEQQWNYIGNRRFVTYSHLQPGLYRFRVRGANNDHIWNPHDTALAIIITAPFWHTGWFLLLTIILFLSVIYLIHRSRTRFIIRRKAELDRLDQMISRARQSALIAHEINNPLFAINNSLQAVKKDQKNLNSSQKQVLQLMDSEMRRLRQIIDQYKQSSEELKVFVMADLKKILHSAMRVLKWGNRLKGVKVKVKSLKDPCPAYCNPSGIQQVLMNIIQNAVSHMAGKGTLELEILRSASHYEIHFTDNGPGFKRDIIPGLFQPYRSDSPGDKGLGLFISYGIIKKHRGEIIIDQNYSPGAHVIIKLPLKGLQSNE